MGTLKAKGGISINLSIFHEMSSETQILPQKKSFLKRQVSTTLSALFENIVIVMSI